MSGKKVFELAKELKIKSKELLELLKKSGIEVSTHMSVLDEVAIATVRERLVKKTGETGKASESFKEIKGSPKTILIKKKPKSDVPKTDVIEKPKVISAAKEVFATGKEEVVAEEKLIEAEQKVVGKTETKVKEPKEEVLPETVTVEEPTEVSVSEAKKRLRC